MPRSAPVPEIRCRALDPRPPRASGDYVLYWMIAARRTRDNFALDRALELCREFGKPLLVLEALRVGYRWASGRLHAFVLDGMADNAAAFERAGVRCLTYLEPEPGDGEGLLTALAERAVAVVTDDFPCFFLPRMVDAASRAIDVRLEAVDGNGLIPIAAAEKAQPTAYAHRRWFQKTFPDHLGAQPRTQPLRGYDLGRARVARAVTARWSFLSGDSLADDARRVRLPAELPIDHDVAPTGDRGGSKEAAEVLRRFVNDRLARYADDRNKPEDDVGSGLSPYLHFGHLGAHAAFRAVVDAEDWSPGDWSPPADGRREGWWGMSPSAEAFLDQLCVWRELGYHFSARRPDYDRWESLPDWARATLDEHRGDPREYVYDLEAFEHARTHDDLWNAAQRQLVREGAIHNYLRMLWGKKVLEWSPSPEAALETLIHLNNKYALDGRNPNSYSGIFWIFGRYDRPWGPERPVFGKIRFMSSANTARKVRVKGYLERYAAVDQGSLF